MTYIDSFLQEKIAKWKGPQPHELEDVYEGTNLLGQDRKILHDSIEDTRSKQGRFKKFLVDHPMLTTLLGTGLGAGAGALLGRSGDAALAGGSVGLLAGGLSSGIADVVEGQKAVDTYERKNPGYMKRYYKNPNRSQYRQKKEENYTRHVGNSITRDRNQIELVRLLNELR